MDKKPTATSGADNQHKPLNLLPVAHRELCKLLLGEEIGQRNPKETAENIVGSVGSRVHSCNLGQ